MNLRRFLLSFFLNSIIIAFASNVAEIKNNQRVIVPFNSCEDKYVEFKITDIAYSDSTSKSCILQFNVTIKSIGQKTKIGRFDGILGSQDYFFGSVVDGTSRYVRFGDPTVVKKNGSIQIPCTVRLYDGDKGSSIYYINQKLFNIPAYDGNVIENLRSKERERIKAETKRRQDSIEVYYMPPVSRLITDYELNIPKGYVLPDTLEISKDKYGIGGKRMMRVINFYGRCDTLFQDGFMEHELRDYNSAIHSAYIRSKPIEEINDRELFYYFTIGDSIQDFLSRLGSKKVHISESGGYQVSFPNALTKEPEIFEFYFWECRLGKISRITTSKRTLPTNDVWTAFQLIKLKDELDDLDKAVKLLRKKTRNSKE